MKKEKKMKLAKFSVAKVNNLALKGGIASNACPSAVACFTEDCATFNPTCKSTVGSRPSDSL